MNATSLLITVSSLLGLACSLIAKPAPAEIVLKGQNTSETGYVTKADSKNIYFSASPTGKNERAYPKKLIARVTFKAPDDWKKAEQLRLSEKYTEAAKLYETIAIDYRSVGALEDNYGSLARLNQLSCLRKLGDYKQIAAKRPLLKKVGLSEKYHAQVDLFVGWGALAKLDTPAEIEQLERLVDNYRGAEMLPSQLAEAYYLSGVANEKSGKPGKALTDYHRVFTLDFGTDEALSKLSMETALKLYAVEHKIHKDRQRLEEAHALAQVCIKVFGDVPKEAARFAEPLPPIEDEDEG